VVRQTEAYGGRFDNFKIHPSSLLSPFHVVVVVDGNVVDDIVRW
jgi:hypothetical protein